MLELIAGHELYGVQVDTLGLFMWHNGVACLAKFADVCLNVVQHVILPWRRTWHLFQPGVGWRKCCDDCRPERGLTRSKNVRAAVASSSTAWGGGRATQKACPRRAACCLPDSPCPAAGSVLQPQTKGASIPHKRPVQDLCAPAVAEHSTLQATFASEPMPK